MNMRDLIPWGRSEQTTPSRYRDEADPFITLHREMNRLFDDVFRSFDVAPFGSLTGAGRTMGWPSVEVSETDREVRITAELPGLSEKDVELMLDNGMLVLRGERKTESDDRDRGYSERFYGRFERRIALPAGVEEDKVEARFDSGVLHVRLPKSPEAERGRRIPINGETRH